MNKYFFSTVEKLNRKLSLVEGEAFFDLAQFPWTQQVEVAAEVIRAELRELVSREDIDIPTMSELSGGQSSLKHTNSWQAICLYLYGQRLCDDPQYLPQTHQILQRIPGLKTAFLSF